ncbi:MAG: glycosyltransferase family 39 protein [Actinomycetales bacterium]|nr:glycosyltransferase family 39 protein [Actinomycetales bacterium]
MATTLAPDAVAPAAAPAAARPRRVPWSLAALLVGTAALYLWGLSASGWANDFYAAAVQAGATDWKAFFFGSLDAGNFITVDKPPASLWVMALSVRVFGLSSWSLLVPQALEGVAAVALLYAAVRRWAGHVPGLVAGAILALTPAAALMFRFDNPDALLVLLMVAAAYAVVRAVEGASTRWLVLAGVAIGFAFLTKMLQGFLVLPAFVLVYLVAAPTSLRRRLAQLLAAAVAVVVSAGWWVAIVELWPASSRPYIGGSTDNSVLDLVLGYNGLARILGQGGGSAGGGVQGSAFGGATGLGRLFSSEMGYEISWLLPAALVALVAGLWLTRGRPRTDRTRAGLLLWGGWLVVTGLVFSFMAGVVHPYYTVALAPAVAALVAIGGGALWQARDRMTARVGLALMAVAAGGWSAVLLDGASAMTWLSPVVGAVGVLAGVALLVVDRRTPRLVAAAVLGAGLIAGLTGSAASAVATAATPHSGSIPTVGLSPSADGVGGFGGGGAGGPGAIGSPGAQAPSADGVRGAPPAGGAGGTAPGAGAGPATAATGGSTADLASLLSSTTSRWSAAVVGDQSAAGLELDSGTAVMAIGGWSGTDPAPTLAQFQEYVASGQVTYYVAGGQGGGRGGADSEIATWVAQSFAATSVGSWTVYDLTS